MLMNRRIAGLCLAAIAVGVGCLFTLQAAEREDIPTVPVATYGDDAELLAEGRELFQREWLPNDPRSPHGDGLGPVFNDSSCAACHNLGGPGGGGAANKNVELLSALMLGQQAFVDTVNGTRLQVASPPVGARRQRAHQEKVRKLLTKVHPDFAKSNAIVVHKFGTSDSHDAWRKNVMFATAQPMVNALQNPAVFPSPADDPFSPVDSTGTTPLPSTDPAGGDEETQPQPARATGVPATLPRPPRRAPEPQSVPAQPTPAPPQVRTFSQPEPLPTSIVTPRIIVREEPVAPVASVRQLAVSQATGFRVLDEALNRIRTLRSEATKIRSREISGPGFVLKGSERNTTALFGAGVIDDIPAAVIEAAAKSTHENFPRVKGRVHRMADGKIGRFGWKAQKATLREFTLSACANELGLDVPGHAQSVAAYDKKEKAHGHDMNARQADALVAYVKSLPAPVQKQPKDKKASGLIDEGKKLFTDVGCATCHKQDMGDAKGIFSDLLLHDLGEGLQASGSYGQTPVPLDDPEPETQAKADGEQAPKKPAAKGPSVSEWKTPPLWGLRDSAPYLHDGRAKTVEQAVAFHGGEAEQSTVRFFMLSKQQRQKVLAFLNTLHAPPLQTASRE